MTFKSQRKPCPKNTMKTPAELCKFGVSGLCCRPATARDLLQTKVIANAICAGRRMSDTAIIYFLQ